VENRVRGKKREADPIHQWGRPKPLGKNQAKALSGTAGVWAQASEEGFAGITSGRSLWQQGLVATCTDSLNEVKNRRKGEPHGIGTCARMSYERGITSSQETVRVSLMKVTPTSGEGALGTWRSLRQVRARLDKTGHTKPRPGIGTKLLSKPFAGGAYVHQHLNFVADGKAHRRKARTSNRTREIWPSGIIGGPRETWSWRECEPTLQPKGEGW
jgi:hypothetical protein